MVRACELNTLQYDPALCTGCRLCVEVCPHGVFQMNGRVAQIVRGEDCMECGACQVNCAPGAIVVDERRRMRCGHDPGCVEG